MRIRKSSWLIKVAYPGFDVGQLPNRISFYRFLLRVIFGLALFPVRHALLALFYAILFFVGFWYASRPAIFKNDASHELMVPYKHWPDSYGFRYEPRFFLFLALIGVFCGSSIYLLIQIAPELIVLMTNPIPFTVAMALLALMGISFFLYLFDRPLYHGLDKYKKRAEVKARRRCAIRITD